MNEYITKNNLCHEVRHVVIFTGASAPLPQKTIPYWKNFTNPFYVIAADSGLETLSIYEDFFKNATAPINFLPNLIVGDMDSIKNHELLKKYSKSAQIEYSPCDKDWTDTELALMHAIKIADYKKQKNIFITLIGGAGGRADHFMAIYSLFGTKLSMSAWLTEEQILFNAQSKTTFVFSCLKNDDIISVSRAVGFPKGGSIKSIGLEWESNKFRKKGMCSVSNRAKSSRGNTPTNCRTTPTENKTQPIKIFVKKGKFVIYAPFSAQLQIFQ